jgi:Flp pilus assembly protein TadD
LLAAAAVIGVLCACSAAPKKSANTLPALQNQDVPSLESDQLGEVSDGMKAFLDQNLPPSMSLADRTWTLAFLASDPYVLDFRYNPAVTLPPAATFERKTGNCLSFSLMLVAMARHAGIHARFQEAVLEPEYSNINDTFVNSRHINVLLGQGSDSYLVDVSGRIFEDQLRTRNIEDREAEAQYYNNLGVEALLDEDLPLAYARFRQALATDPGLAYLWSNLGVVYNRNRQVAAAEYAYRTAMSVDDRDSIAANNLYVIYLQEGRESEAANLRNRVERHRKRNPYYLAKLAGEALQEQQYAEAIDLLQRSIKINGREYRFHGALAQALYLSGNYQDATASLDLARSLAPPDAAAELESLPLRSLPK